MKLDIFKSPLFLWMLLAAVILFIMSAAIIDRAVHSRPASTDATAVQPSAVSVPPAVTSPPKTGWRVGDQAHDFELTTIDNRDIKLSDYRGKKVVLNFWATWCGPCRLEIPFLKSANAKLSEKGTVMISVCTQDTFENAQRYASVNKLEGIIPVDPRGIVSSYYNIRGIPTTYFIDEKGIITSVKIGPFLSEGEIIERLSVSE